MKITCLLGFHKWSKWIYIKPIGRYECKLKKECKSCGKEKFYTGLFEIHINKDAIHGYVIENLGISNQEKIKSNIGFDVDNIDADNEIYSIVADFNHELDAVNELQNIFNRVKISFFRKLKLEKINEIQKSRNNENKTKKSFQ